MTHRILIGNVRDTLRSLPDNSVHCCVTSPPYFGLRSYLPDGHPDKPLEIGSEPTAEEFLATMVEVFAGVKRVLRDDGVLFLNLGDSYADSTKWGGRSGEKNGVSTRGNNGFPRTRRGTDKDPRRSSAAATQPKRQTNNGQLANMPHRLAEALRADGWRWRQTIVWAKKSPMPEAISGWKWVPCCDGCNKCEAGDGWVLRRGKGRCTTAHEYVFVLSKSDTYFWDTEVSKEPTAGTAHDRGKGVSPKSGLSQKRYERNNDSFSSAVAGLVTHRNPRSVWTLSSEPTKAKHFATFPSELVRRCLVAGVSSAGCCPACGAPWAPVVETTRTPIGQGRYAASTECLGYRQTCDCPPHSPRPCVVLDPFSGLGTTGQTAVFLGHEYIGCELSAEYAAISERRIKQPPVWWLRQQKKACGKPRMAPPVIPGQGSLFD